MPKLNQFFILVFLYIPVVHAMDDLAVMGIIKDKVILRIDGAHYTTKKGESPVAGVKLINIGEKRKKIILEINGEQRLYKLGHGTRTAVASIKLQADVTGIHRTEGKINNQSVPFIIDTGATYVSLNSVMATDLGINYQQSTEKGQSETANGLVDVYIINLSSVEVGDIKLNNVRAAVHEGEYPSMALLGMSFLKQLKIEREDDVLSLQMR